MEDNKIEIIHIGPYLSFYPLQHIVIDKDCNLYLLLRVLYFTDFDNPKYIATDVSIDTLSEYINGKISLSQLFELSNNYYRYTYYNKNYGFLTLDNSLNEFLQTEIFNNEEYYYDKHDKLSISSGVEWVIKEYINYNELFKKHISHLFNTQKYNRQYYNKKIVNLLKSENVSFDNIEYYINEYPDQRFGQIISNYYKDDNILEFIQTYFNINSDFFYEESEVTYKRLINQLKIKLLN